MNEFLILLCLQAQVLLYLIDHLYPNPDPSSCAPILLWGLREGLCGAELPTGVNPAQLPGLCWFWHCSV